MSSHAHFIPVVSCECDFHIFATAKAIVAIMRRGEESLLAGHCRSAGMGGQGGREGGGEQKGNGHNDWR